MAFQKSLIYREIRCSASLIWNSDVGIFNFSSFLVYFDGVFARGWVLGLGWQEKYWCQEIPKGLSRKCDKQAFRPNFTRKSELSFVGLLLWCLHADGHQTCREGGGQMHNINRPIRYHGNHVGKNYLMPHTLVSRWWNLACEVTIRYQWFKHTAENEQNLPCGLKALICWSLHSLYWNSCPNIGLVARRWHFLETRSRRHALKVNLMMLWAAWRHSGAWRHLARLIARDTFPLFCLVLRSKTSYLPTV